jgi:hypothetical protein
LKLKAKRRDAFERYAEPLQRVLSCVTSEPLIRRRSEEVEEFFLANSPAHLAGCGLLLAISQYFQIISNEGSDEYAVRTESYAYQIMEDATGKELFAFHWEPHSRVQYPHMHLGFAARGHGLPIDNKAHIPSGRVAVEDMVTFLIADLGAKPLKDDWASIIETERLKFMDKKHW